MLLASAFRIKKGKCKPVNPHYDLKSKPRESNGNVEEEESHEANHPSEWVRICIDLKGLAGKESGAQCSERHHRSKDWDIFRLRGTELQPSSMREFCHGRWSRDFWGSWKKPLPFLPFEKGRGEKGGPGGCEEVLVCGNAYWWTAEYCCLWNSHSTSTQLGMGPKEAPSENTVKAQVKVPLCRIDVMNVLSFSLQLSSSGCRFCKWAFEEHVWSRVHSHGPTPDSTWWSLFSSAVCPPGTLDSPSPILLLFSKI